MDAASEITWCTTMISPCSSGAIRTSRNRNSGQRVRSNGPRASSACSVRRAAARAPAGSPDRSEEASGTAAGAGRTSCSGPSRSVVRSGSCRSTSAASAARSRSASSGPRRVSMTFRLLVEDPG